MYIFLYIYMFSVICCVFGEKDWGGYFFSFFFFSFSFFPVPPRSPPGQRVNSFGGLIFFLSFFFCLYYRGVLPDKG